MFGGLEKAGKDPLQKLVGVHFGERFDYADWLKKHGRFRVVSMSGQEKIEADVYMYARLQTLALSRTVKGHNYWVAGTRNRTEATIGTYSNASQVAAVLPISPLWKSEVFKLCEHLGVPDKLVFDSRYLTSGGCGQCVIGEHAQAIDTAIMVEQGLLHPDCLEEIRGVDAKSMLERMRRDYKASIPYQPGNEILEDL